MSNIRDWPEAAVEFTRRNWKDASLRFARPAVPLTLGFQAIDQIAIPLAPSPYMCGLLTVVAVAVGASAGIWLVNKLPKPQSNSFPLLAAEILGFFAAMYGSDLMTRVTRGHDFVVWEDSVQHAPMPPKPGQNSTPRLQSPAPH